MPLLVETTFHNVCMVCALASYNKLVMLRASCPECFKCFVVNSMVLCNGVDFVVFFVVWFWA